MTPASPRARTLCPASCLGALTARPQAAPQAPAGISLETLLKPRAGGGRLSTTHSPPEGGPLLQAEAHLIVSAAVTLLWFGACLPWPHLAPCPHSLRGIAARSAVGAPVKCSFRPPTFAASANADASCSARRASHPVTCGRSGAVETGTPASGCRSSGERAGPGGAARAGRWGLRGAAPPPTDSSCPPGSCGLGYQPSAFEIKWVGKSSFTLGCLISRTGMD